jgi:mono/diheme cytochrome c family protein
MRCFAFGWLLVALVCAHASASEAALSFTHGGETRELTKETLRAACALAVVEVDDPYYRTVKRFRACPLARVLKLGFGDARTVAGQDLLLRAVDGYTRSVSGDQLLLEGVYLAFEDADHEAGGFFPIDRRQVDPAPFYMIWTGEGRSDTAAWPWPYQLRTIEIAPFEARFPHTVPAGAEADSAALLGYGLFRKECFSCHAINGEGGKVGPDLNVPQSITAYRPNEQIRAFIRNPTTFRYTTMPSHEHLSDAELDQLLAYLQHMSELQHDPGGPSH